MRAHALAGRVRALRLWSLRTLRVLEADPLRARRALIAVWTVSRLILFAGLLIGHAYCDPEFYHYAGQLAAGHFPYRDFQVEYPPLAMLLIMLPAVPLLPLGPLAPRPDPDFGGVLTTLPAPDPVRYGVYGASFGLEMLAIDAITLWLVWRTARRLSTADLTPLRAGLLYVLLTFACGAVLQKFDLAAGMLCLAAVLALTWNRCNLAWTLIALATLVKGFPLLVLPVVAAYYLARTRRTGLLSGLRRRADVLLEGVLTFGAVIIGITLVVVLLAGIQPVINTIMYHAGRGTELESVYATIMMAVGWVPHWGVYTGFNSGDLSAVIQSPLDAWTAPLSIVILIAVLGVTYAAIWRAITRTRGSTQPKLVSGHIIATGVVAVLLAFELTFRALPAHYLLAVLPLAAIVRLPQPQLQQRWVWSLLLTALFGQAVVIVWPALVLLRPWAVFVLILRNAAWVIAFVSVLMALWQWPLPSVNRARPTHVSAQPDIHVARAPASAR